MASPKREIVRRLNRKLAEVGASAIMDRVEKLKLSDFPGEVNRIVAAIEKAFSASGEEIDEGILKQELVDATKDFLLSSEIDIATRIERRLNAAAFGKALIKRG